ncbi:MAG TPA: ATP-binding protein [Ktedonobacterales bacterium]
MDAVRFGRWLADRRRDCGWASQRTLAVAAQTHPRTSGLAISEAFLARLEAGLLVHPFRGAVRRRVVGLAWLLCRSARQVRDYVKVADLGSLTRAETAEIDALARSLSEAVAPYQVLLPPPPACLIGRDESLADLGAALADPALRGRCCLITGMPGVGKTSLAVAAAHRLVGSPQGAATFADGIVSITCRGRHGASGALTILEDMLAFRQSPPPDRSTAPQLAADRAVGVELGNTSASENAFARAADRMRWALAGKRLLILLDGVESDLPLDHTLDALLPHSFSRVGPTAGPSDAIAAPVVLVTSCWVPPDVSRFLHIHLPPLAPDDGVRLIEHVLGTTLDGDDRQAALRLCAATGGIPLAIEAAATTLAQTGIPLAVLAAAAEHDPRAVFGGSGGGENAVARAIDALPAEMRTQLALLSVLQAESFGLAAVSALRSESPDRAIMMTSALVRQSLLEPARLGPSDANAGSVAWAGEAGVARDARFRLPPLVRAYAAERARSLPAAMVESARGGLGAYADTCIERCGGSTEALAAEADVLRAALSGAVQDGAHARTLRLVHGLLPVALQRDTCGAIEQLVLAGIHAGKAITDQRAVVSLLNFLGIMRLYQGDNARARRAWAHCIQISGDLSQQDGHHGAAYLNLAELADLEGEPDAAWHLAELGLYYSRKAGSAVGIACALLIQAERARCGGKHRIAHAYASEGLELILAAGSDKSPRSQRAYVAEARLELARVERDYATASAYADQYVALTGTGSEYRLFLAEELIDQAKYALEADANQDAIRLAGHALAIADDAQATALSQRARAVWHRAERPHRSWRRRAAGE